MKNQVFYFVYSDKGFVYSLSSNDMFEVSEIAKGYFEKEKNEDVVLNDEIVNLLNLPENNSPLPNELFLKNPSIDLISKYINNIENKFVGFVILELNNQPEILNLLLSQPISEKVRIVLKQNINYIINIETITKVINKKIDLIYYTDVDTLEKIVQSNDIRNKIFIELRIKSEVEFLKYLNLILPNNFIISFRIESNDISEIVLKFLEDKIKSYFENRNNNISNYLDIVRLLKFNFGRQYNNVHKFNSDKEKSLNISCNNCWAKKICHQTRLYTLFDEDLFLTQQDNRKCDSIRTFSEKYLKLLLFFKEIKAKEMLPFHFKKNGYKIKIINP